MAGTSWGHAGAFEFQVFRVDSNGYPVGQETDPDNIDTSSGSVVTHALRSDGFVSMSPAETNRRRATFFGNEQYLGSLYLGVDDFGEGSIELSQFNELFMPLLADTTLDQTTVSNWTIMAVNELLQSPPRVGFMTSAKIRTISGAIEWAHILYPDVQFDPGNPGMSNSDGQNPNNTTISYTVNPASRSPLGTTMANLGIGVAEGKAGSLIIRAPYRLGISTWIQDGTDTSFVLGHRPIRDDTGGTDNSFNLNGVDDSANISSVDTTTGAVAVTTAGSDGDKTVAVYATDFQAI